LGVQLGWARAAAQLAAIVRWSDGREWCKDSGLRFSALLCFGEPVHHGDYISCWTPTLDGCDLDDCVGGGDGDGGR
jgi:hypothetical protein